MLALYGKLAHGMTRKTFVSGEGHTIAPAPGEYFRSMCLPPNNANNDVFPAGSSISAARVVGSGRAVPFSGETLDLAGLTGSVALQADLR